MVVVMTKYISEVQYIEMQIKLTHTGAVYDTS